MVAVPMLGLSSSPSPAAPVPVPGFEGFEKRLEISFAAAGSASLRSLRRCDIDTVLTAAECTIVSQLSNQHFDSYILSESSLFVYPTKIVIKTCGTTQLLKSIPELLTAAYTVGLERVVHCRYTRGSFMFPSAQPFPHRSFDEEVFVLDQYFGNLNNRRSFVMGDDNSKHKWHVYVASSEPELATISAAAEPVFTLEICMTQLDRAVAKSFFKSSAIQTGEDMTKAASIQELLPRSTICDFSFDPCGYSMNGMEGAAHSTIHVTPEDGFSYASFESMGYNSTKAELNELIDRVVGCFKPGSVSVSVHAEGSCNDPSSWERPISVPAGYLCSGRSRQELRTAASISYYTFSLAAGGSQAAITKKAKASVQKPH